MQLQNDVKSLYLLNNLSIFAIEIGFDEDVFWNYWIDKTSLILTDNTYWQNFSKTKDLMVLN